MGGVRETAAGGATVNAANDAPEERRERPKLTWGPKVPSSPSEQPEPVGEEAPPAAEVTSPSATVGGVAVARPAVADPLTRRLEVVDTSQLASVAGFGAGEFQQLLSSLMDFKVDLKLEMQRLHQRLGRLEGSLSDVTRRMQQRGVAPPVPAPQVSPPMGRPDQVGDSGAVHRTEGGAAGRVNVQPNQRAKESIGDTGGASGGGKGKHKQRSRPVAARGSEESPTDSMVQRMLEAEICADAAAPAKPLFADDRPVSPEQYL